MIQLQVEVINKKIDNEAGILEIVTDRYEEDDDSKKEIGGWRKETRKEEEDDYKRQLRWWGTEENRNLKKGMRVIILENGVFDVIGFYFFG